MDSIEADRPDSLEAFIAESFETTRAALKYRLIIAGQAVSDVAAHIVSAMEYGAPETAADGVRELSKRHVVPAGLAAQMAEVVGMRNVLVHEYLVIDPAQVFAALHDVGPLKEFVGVVSGWTQQYGR